MRRSKRWSPPASSPSHTDPTDHRRQDVRAERSPAADSGPHMEPGEVGRRGQPVVPARVHAGPEPGRLDRDQPVRPLDVRTMVLATDERDHLPPEGERVLRPGLRHRHRGVLRTSTGPGDAERLGRHGGVQRHPDRQRHRLSDDHRRSEVVPVPHPQRRRRPLLQPVPVRGRHDRHLSRYGGGPQGERGRGGPGRPDDRPHPGHDG